MRLEQFARASDAVSVASGPAVEVATSSSASSSSPPQPRRHEGEDHERSRADRAHRRRWRSVELIGLLEDGGRLLDGSAGTGQALLVDRQLGAPGIDRLLEPLDGEVGQLLGDLLEAGPYVVELSGHGSGNLPAGAVAA